MSARAPSPSAARSRLASFGWLGPVAVVIGWMAWAYARLRPPAAIVARGLRGYNPWGFQHLSYSDLLALYRDHHLANHAAPYVHVIIEYPVLTGLFMWSAAWTPAGVDGYFLASAIGLLASMIGIVVLLYRVAPIRAWTVALSPLLLVFSLLNWDVFGIFLMVAGWMLYRSGRYVLSGVVLSLAIFAKFFPFVLLYFLLLELWHDRHEAGKAGAWRQLLVAAAATAVVVNLPFAVLNLSAWNDFFTYNASRPDADGLLYLLHIATHWSIGASNALSAALVAVVLLALGLLVLRRGRAEFAAAIGFSWFLMLNKVFSPQYMLWILVYAVIAEWPIWTIPVLSGAGLIDFANAMMTLHLSNAHAGAFSWYFETVFPMNRGIRLAAISCGIVAAICNEVLWHRRQGPIDPRPRGAPGDPVPPPARPMASYGGVAAPAGLPN